MSTIHDKYKKRPRVLLDNENESPIDSSTQISKSEEAPSVETTVVISPEANVIESKAEIHSANAQELNRYLQVAENAMSMVDDIVLKQYLTKLENLDIVPITKDEIGKNIILFKINKMVYEKDEFVTEKFISAISAMTYADCSIFLVVDGYPDHTDFYLGIRNNDEQKEDRSVAETFRASLKGQFPGIILEDCSIVEKGENSSDQEILLHRISQATTVSSCVGVPSFKDEDGTYTNANYVQGIEKMALAMQGRRYTAIVLASNLTPAAIEEMRVGYENLYTQLSAISTQQLAYTTNESLANAVSRSNGYSDSVSDTHSEGKSHTDGTNTSKTINESVSNKGGWAKAGSIIGGALAAVGGVALMATGFGIPAGAALVVGGGLAAAGASGKTKTKGSSETTGSSHSDTTTVNDSHGETHTETFQETTGKTATIGSGKNFTLTLHNKHVEELQKRIDKQLERIAMSESTGLWSTATYFFSFDNDVASAETGAAIFKSIMQGEGSGVEASAVSTWYGSDNLGNSNTLTQLANSVCSFRHPLFEYSKDGLNTSFPVENSSLINSKELSMMLSLPRKSVPGLPVVEHVSLAKEVVRHNGKEIKRPLHLGCIFDQGVEHIENDVKLDSKSLTQHVFVTGSTGCGKSETVYRLIHEARRAGAKFMIIEPAKGEYKNVFGDVNVYGTNPNLTPLLRINPFRFPKGIHVLEHIDRLTEIFNVCWPMYAAMPAVLKKAMLKAYENCGWDLYHSVNTHSDSHDLFPSFSDLLVELENAINSSAYSEEVKGNYTGSLVTRVESLTNGINGEIFSEKEISDEKLFNEDTIVDLSRVGSQETKALIMGILIMRLSEFRMVSAKEANAGLKHITVLEEAHNILKRTSTEQSMEGSNVAGKSVEMITNAIAEMRTYGEGFIIVDQSPTSVDQAAIKNTNTKIIMRLPDGDDREISGKAAGMKDNQIDEIAKLPTGVAVVYQNDWISPVLSKIKQYDGARNPFSHRADESEIPLKKETLSQVISFLMGGRLRNKISKEQVEEFPSKLNKLALPTQLRIKLINLVKEYNATGTLSLWENENFPELAKMVTQILGLKTAVEKATSEAKDFNDLNVRLSSLINESLETSESLNLNLRQCLMEDWGESNPTRRRIADVWADDLRLQLK